jgi:hypothetical protein
MIVSLPMKYKPCGVYYCRCHFSRSWWKWIKTRESSYRPGWQADESITYPPADDAPTQTSSATVEKAVASITDKSTAVVAESHNQVLEASVTLGYDATHKARQTPSVAAPTVGPLPTILLPILPQMMRTQVVQSALRLMPHRRLMRKFLWKSHSSSQVVQVPIRSAPSLVTLAISVPTTEVPRPSCDSSGSSHPHDDTDQHVRNLNEQSTLEDRQVETTTATCVQRTIQRPIG